MSTPTQCGFVSVIGMPNAGKSTFINALVGAKVSIVSRKVQTTRTRILGILVHKQAQIILVDTPGIFVPKKTLEKAMVKVAWDAMGDADLNIHIVDGSMKNIVSRNLDIIRSLPKNTVLVLNKIDQMKKTDLLKLAQDFNDQFDYQATFMVSSLKKKGLDVVLDYCAEHLPQGPWAFEVDEITDQPIRMMAAEITREKVYEQLHEELPYSIMIETESWEEFDNGSVKITQLVYVQRDSQKSIVLGKGGARIRQLGEKARMELEAYLEQRVHLKLFVKVKENWPDHPDTYRLMGLDQVK